MTNRLDPSQLLELAGIVKDFKHLLPGRSVRALDGISFGIRPEQIVGLVGPNGSGKTTAFRIAAGLLRQSKGSVRVMNKEPGSMAARRIMGYMPEQTGLPGTLTPREILRFIGRIFDLAPFEAKARIQDLEKLLNLDAFMDRRLSRLSKGMLKRVGLATALLNRPVLLLLDEPIEGLDPLGAAELKQHLKAIAREGTGILISSHILSDVEAICNRIIILHKGRVILEGDRDAILSAKDRMEIRFHAPDGENLLEEFAERIKTCGGSVDFAGHPRQELETLFKKLVKEQSPASPGERP